jgi:5,10-methylenetetrahydromethanopterin reductase
MRVGMFFGGATVAATVDAARAAAAQGFSSFWMPQIFGVDALTTLAIVGHEVPGIELGTAVVQTHPRHPMMLGAQARTVAEHVGNRLTLGIGPSHQVVIEGMFGMSYGKPIRHMREYLSILGPLLRNEPSSFAGETLTFRGAVEVGNSAQVPVLVAALGEQMLHLCGTLADGTITWCVGPKTLASFTVPTLHAAAESAGRDPATMRVASGIPICVTDDIEAARASCDRDFAVYPQLPSYRAMLDREGAATVADLAFIGDEATVSAQLDDLAASGCTEMAASMFGSREDRDRTSALLAGRAALAR